MKNKEVLRQIARIFAGEVFCIAVMLGIYALLDKLNSTVILGAVLGGLVSIGNFVALSIIVSSTADKAEAQADVKKLQVGLQGTTFLRLLCVAGLLILLIKSGKCDPIATILPLLFVQISIPLTTFFRKGGEAS
ncbi:MAG: ATP synthase subunit I [Oscillospiraceae bacterium]|nr:ATP synthase subunit I [Oscillospiraceae bacterium]